MATLTRIYKIHHTATDSTRLVRANNVAQAVRHVANDSFISAVAGQDDLVHLISKGVKVEEAAKEAAE